MWGSNCKGRSSGGSKVQLSSILPPSLGTALSLLRPKETVKEEEAAADEVDDEEVEVEVEVEEKNGGGNIEGGMEECKNDRYCRWDDEGTNRW
jgi:hypothetical protein